MKKTVVSFVSAAVLFALGALLGSHLAHKPSEEYSYVMKYRILYSPELSGPAMVDEAKKFHYDIVMFTEAQAKQAGHSVMDIVKPGTLVGFERMTRNDAMVAIDFDDWEEEDDKNERNYAFCLFATEHGGISRVFLGDNSRLFDEDFYITPVEAAASYLYELDTEGSPIQGTGGSISFAENND
ncbi:MAG: hypothetical protein IKZ82_01065 [Clostridia bacterium]|nr:hypothetical protein [Clostridia bacterium]